MNTVGVISLGCDKNRVDTENMLKYLSLEGFEFVGDPKEAEILIVNTCAFIESAKREAIETILEMSEYKSAGKCKCLVVTGCLPQRYMEELREDMPEIDIILGTGSYSELPRMLKEFAGTRLAVPNDKDYRKFTSGRILTTPYTYAYLKIAEGCDNRCTYCAIPMIRGRYTSRPMDELIEEARNIIGEYGVKELILVAQDVTRYGEDIYGENKLIALLDELTKLDIKWVRLLYCYPEQVTDELIDYVAHNPKMAKYFDIPMQHANDRVLKRMNRRVRQADLKRLIERIRSADSDISIRSTFIVGFPGETEEQFNELAEFLQNAELDKCGFFAYSCEEGTPAARLGGQIPEEIKEERVKTLYEIQSAITERAVRRVGRTYTAVYEDIDYDNGKFIMRMEYDAPEIDGVILAESKIPLEIGEFYKVKITDTDGIDYKGTVIGKEE